MHGPHLRCSGTLLVPSSSICLKLGAGLTSSGTCRCRQDMEEVVSVHSYTIPAVAIGALWVHSEKSPSLVVINAGRPPGWASLECPTAQRGPF
jgi:hypothetical protein